MTATLDIEFGPPRVDPIPVAVTAVDVTLLTGPARLIGWSLREASGDVQGSAEGTVTSPGAVATIAATAVKPAGTYDVSWLVSLAGTLAAGDANNFQLQVGGVTAEGSLNGIVAGNYPQAGIRVVLSAPGTISIASIAAGTVGAVYGGQLEAIPVAQGSAVAEIRDGNQPLAEIGLNANGSDTHAFTHGGIHVRGQLQLHIVSGAVTGVVYAVLDPD